MTNEQVDEMENKLREAQKLVEEAGQMVCSEDGRYAVEIWNKLTILAEEVGNNIHQLYRLRPENAYSDDE